jgi:DNA invertase Pin-like site-specific DNA recombinase
MARKSRKSLEENKCCVAICVRVGVYVRLSVEDTKKRGDSIESQRCIIENYIALNPDFEIVDTYIDNGISGTTFERAEFNRMLADIESGKVNCIVVKDLSRLGRNTIDTGYYIEKYFPAANVRFIAVNDNYDSGDKDSVHGGIIIPLKNMINEAYALDQSRKIREQQRQSMLVGDYVGAKPPFGYLKSPENCHKLIIDTEAAAVVRQIFGWFLDGTSANHIVRRLNEAKVLTPSYHLYKLGIITNKNILGNGSWQTQTLTHILTRETYVGDMIQGKSKGSRSSGRSSAPESEWICVSDTHEPIVSREDFAKTQERLKFLADRHAAKPKSEYTPNLFKSKVFCGHCGGSMNRRKGHKTKCGDVYRFCCLSNERKARGSCEGTSTLREDVLLSKLLTAVNGQADSIHRKAQYLRLSENSVVIQRQEARCKIADFRREIDKCRRLSKSLYESNISGLITHAEYQEMRANYECKINECTESISKLENWQNEFDKQVEEYCELSDLIAGMDNNGVTADLVQRLINKVVFFSDKHIEFVFSFESKYVLLSEVVV